MNKKIKVIDLIDKRVYLTEDLGLDVYEDLVREVEILEDNTEEIEELKGWGLATDYKDFETINHTLDRFGNKINELVKAIRQIRKDLNK